MRSVSPELYLAFTTVTDAGGFTAAAQRLHRTQATVSQQITRLETLLERPLFTRTTRSVRLTAAGQALLPYARQILRLQDQAADAVTGATQQPLRLGVPDQYADAVLPALIEVLRRETSGIFPVVQCDQSVELFERFSRGDVDIILTARYPNFPAGRTVSVEDLVWVGCRDFPARLERPLPLVLYPAGCPFRARALAALRYAEQPWEVVCTAQSGAALHSPLALGLGITIMSRRTVPADLEELGEGLHLPAVTQATLDLHVSVPVAEQFGPTLEEAAWRAAARALDQGVSVPVT
jgi:DNA-binding transcriptional LysR family regulator